VGLFLLRAFVSFRLIQQTTAYVASATAVTWIVIAISVVTAACLLTGFLTPVGAVVVTLGATLVSIANLSPDFIEIIVLSVAIALLGPGAFSLDARLFGRREILLPNTPRSSKS